MMAPSSSSSSFPTHVHKPYTKPWKKQIGKPAAAPPRIYRVDSSDFRKIVQKLTGAPEIQTVNLTGASRIQTNRLRQLAPPPLNLSIVPPSNKEVSEVKPEPFQYYSPQRFTSRIYANTDMTFDDAFFSIDTGKLVGGFSPVNSFGLLSPSWFTGCSLPVLSPGTLASLEPSTVP